MERIASKAIALEGVSKKYGGAKEQVVLDELNLTVTQGHIHGLLGPNGAGKTTAVRIMTTLLAPDAGSVRVAGHDAVHSGARVRERIGLVGQSAAVDEDLTGRQNLVMFSRLNRYTARSAKKRADELLEQFGLAEAAGRRAKTYSGGMRRRLDLAAGLITAPEVLFVDEPTTGLDPAVRRDVWQAIQSLAREGTTVLLTTQYLEEADQLTDRISMLGRGRVAREGTPAELKNTVGHDWLEVTPGPGADPASYEKVLAPWASGRITSENGVLRVPLADRGSSLLSATASIKDAGLPVEDLSVRTPSLDEVFIQVTGQSALEPDNAEGATSGKDHQ